MELVTVPTGAPQVSISTTGVNAVLLIDVFHFESCGGVSPLGYERQILSN